MNKLIIADSSGLVSLISQTDQNHAIAAQVTKNLENAAGLIIVPSDVFSELLNVVGRKIGHAIAIKAGQEIMESKTYMVLEANDETRLMAFDLFKNQSELVSFTDCMVMAFANQFDTKDIFGFDKVFHQNGFNRLGFDQN